MSRKVGDSAELVATTSSKAGARSWDQDATHGCLNVYVSMTVQSIFGMDKSKMTCDMFIELDFKYDAGAYCKAFGSSPGITGDAATSAKDALIQAEALKMPWLILNAGSCVAVPVGEDHSEELPDELLELASPELPYAVILRYRGSYRVFEF